MNRTWSIGLPALALGTVLLASQAPAHAAGINLLQTLMPAPGEPDPTGGTVLASSTVPVVAASFTGTLTSTVIANDTSNPLNGLTFTYVVSNAQSSIHPIGRFTVNGYEGFQTDASYETPSTGLAPTLINRPQADVLGFNFIANVGPGVLAPGMTSAVLVIQTNAPAFTNDFASVINGYTATVPTFAPVPEPATIALMAMGLGAVAIRRRAH